MRRKKRDSLQNFLEAIYEGIREKKGENIIDINLSKLNPSICDHFIICEAETNIHVRAIADAINEKVKKIIGVKPWHIEGYQNAEWVLIDYIDIIIHVFLKPKREFYDLEGLWADAEIVKINSN